MVQSREDTNTDFLQGEPSKEALSDADSISDDEAFSTHGLHVALTSAVRLPFMGNMTKRDLKSDKYRTDVSDHHVRVSVLEPFLQVFMC